MKPLHKLGRGLIPHRYSEEDALQVLGHPCRPALGPHLRCLVWNILKARRGGWANDFTELSADRDLVLLQEAVLRAPSDKLFTDSERFGWVMARSFRDSRNGIEHGVKTGSVAASSAQDFFLSPHAEPLSNTQKLLLVTHYPLVDEQETLLVVNVHAINFVGIAKYVRQLEQVDAAIALHTGPVILAGDFNTWSSARLEQFSALTDRAGLVEASMDRRSRLAHLNSHLDHLYYRGLILHAVESLQQVSSSDHAPIIATFERVRPGSDRLT